MIHFSLHEEKSDTSSYSDTCDRTIKLPEQADRVNILTDAIGHQLSILHRMNNSCGLFRNIPCGKNTLAGGHAIWILTSENISFFIDINAACRRDNAACRAASDGQQNDIGLKHLG